jgi:hypothetical protein
MKGRPRNKFKENERKEGKNSREKEKMLLRISRL